MYKAVVIGAGPAGYTCAIRIAQLGGSAVLVERDLVGGICINWGCTPSKAMITSAKIAKHLKEASEYGINIDNYKIDFAKVAERRDEVIADSRDEIRKLLDHWKIEVIEGTAQIISPNTVKVGDRSLEAENIVIATGSEPLVPGFLQKEDASIVNSNKLITIKELPEQLTIVGGGIIGLEIATIFSNLGTKVRIVELLDRCLATFDPEISAAITERLVANGVEVLTGHKVLDITAGKLQVEKAATGEQLTLDSPLNLIAIGRKAVFDIPALDQLSIKYDKRGVTVDEKLRTSVPNVYAIGDATGQSILAHVAIQQAVIAAETMFGMEQRNMNYEVIPAVVYTLPEIATVGTIPTELAGIKVASYPFKANLRANIDGQNYGFARLWYAEQNRKLIAVQIIGDMAGEIIQAYADIIAFNLDIEAVANTIHAHPTYGEIVRNSLEYLLGRAIEYID